MSNQAWLIPDVAPSGVRDVLIRLPEGDEWEALARGALALLLISSNYEQPDTSSITPDDAASFFADALIDTFGSWG